MTPIRMYAWTLKLSSYPCVVWIHHTNTHIRKYSEIIFTPMCCLNAWHEYACTYAPWNYLHTHVSTECITPIRMYACSPKLSSYPCVFWIHHTNTRVRNYSEIFFIHMCWLYSTHQYACTHVLWNNLHTHVLSECITQIRVYACTLKLSSYPFVLWTHVTNTRVHSTLK